MTQIPDAAVQAAAKCYTERVVSINDTFSSLAREMLTAALPHLPLGFEVKRLIWVGFGNDLKAYAFGISSFYTISGRPDDWSLIWPGENRYVVNEGFTTQTDAKAAAQADFERRLRECIIAKPVDVAAVRRQAFEEAATLIDEGFEKEVGKPWRNDGKPSKNDRCLHDKFMYEDCENCASTAIRALSTEPAQGES